MKERVLMAMSGGVDSTAAAIILLQQGYELVGATYRVYDSISSNCAEKEKGCCSINSLFEAKEIAEKLGKPLNTIKTQIRRARAAICQIILDKE